STVFPAPRGPDSTTTSPARSCSPNREPRATVSSTRAKVAVPPSSMAPQPFPQTPEAHCSPARADPLYQPDQPVIDGVGLVQQRQVTGTADDDKLGSRQRGRHLPRVFVGGEQVVITAGDQGRDLE